MVFGKIENIFISGTKLALHFLKSRDFCISLLLGLDFDVIDQMKISLLTFFCYFSVNYDYRVHFYLFPRQLVYILLKLAQLLMK